MKKLVVLLVLLVSCGGSATDVPATDVPATDVPATDVPATDVPATEGLMLGDIGPGGGIVFYVASGPFTSGAPCGSSCRYLEAAPEGWYEGKDPIRSWSADFNIGADVDGADGLEIGIGYQNTVDIVAQSGNDAASSAAVLAWEYSGGGQTDWFLPSQDELSLMSEELIMTGVGGFVTSLYWSSSELDAEFAWALGLGGQANGNKLGTLYVRPVRAF